MSGYGNADDDAINAMAFVENHIELCRSLLPSGESAIRCLECDDIIPEARRQALPGVKYCIPCQQERDKNRPNIRVVTYML